MNSSSVPGLRRRFVVAATALVVIVGASIVTTTPATATVRGVPSVVPLAAGPATDAVPSDPFAVTGCRTTSATYPWGREELRTWTPVDTQPGGGSINDPGIARGAPFSARIVSAFGRDTEISKELVTLEDATGCRRTWPVESFSTSDRQVIARERVAHPPAADPAAYALFHDPAFVTAADVDAGRASVHETQHFAIWFGGETSAFSYQLQEERGVDLRSAVRTLGDWMEESWFTVRDQTGAPMPFAHDVEKRKVNIYICGTGLPWFSDTGDCGASAGSRSMFVSARYILNGSSTMVHEFAHVLQDFTGGFTGDVPGVGNIWEGHANWVSASTGSYFNVWYYQNLENGPDWHTNYYGMFPLLLQLSQSDRTRDLVWRAWRENLRSDDGQSEELFLETVIRLGEAEGIYPDGTRSFADEIGWYGARLAASDFEQGRVFEDTKNGSQEGSRFVGLNGTDERDTWSSPTERPLWQYGSHLIPLTVQSDASAIQVRLRGETTEQAAGWRYALVSVGTDGAPRYSSLGAADPSDGDVVTLPTTDPEARYYLAVSATPDRLGRLGDADNPDPAPTTFPYSVALRGASPMLPGAGTCLGPYDRADAANLNWHTNGHHTFDRPCDRIGPAARFTLDPADVHVPTGSPASFTAAATHRDGTEFRWQVLEPSASRWTDVAGTPSQLTLAPGRPTGTLVRSVAVGADGAVIPSGTAKLTVVPQDNRTTTTLRLDRTEQTYRTGPSARATVTVTAPSGTVVGGRVTLLDGASSIASVAVGSSGTVTVSIPSALTHGRHEVRAAYVPSDTVTKKSTSEQVVLIVAKAKPTMTLRLDRTTQTFGSATRVRATADIGSIGGTNPAGTVTFKHADTTLGVSTVTRGTATLLLPATTPAGTANIRAVFAPGDASVAGASSALRQVIVTKAASTTTAALQPTSVKPRATVTVKVSVQVPGVARPVGEVTISTGKTTIRTAQLAKDASGKIMITFPAPDRPGKSTYTVSYAGNPNISASTAKAVTLSVR
ncbi:Ig-like domain repeat protein [Curtobacterium albidum]|uniref:Ig-like domain repeat protein n=1 Tax=Curtobacterium citreum TaxID=2036 RepID=A0A850DP09_9MICO|nr:DUF6055 domain-containing protein [Curtobacterium albidum]NUU27197.1 Ig-like domain repeat protein [Curtobacterium albidum]